MIALLFALQAQAVETSSIQTLQRKEFMKMGRYELSPRVGFVANDPFINRYLFGAGLTYHVTEVLGIEASGTASPDLGEADWKPVTHQLIEHNSVVPDISRILAYGEFSIQFSPFYGKFAIREKIIGFDLFLNVGTGAVLTHDDLIGLDETPAAQATQSQVHPTLNIGGGARVILSDALAIRMEGRSLSYIEVLQGNQLEMKNNMTLLTGASLFF